jgi:hypothetical protein
LDAAQAEVKAPKKGGSPKGGNNKDLEKVKAELTKTQAQLKESEA